ncbi:hypothetical protein K456DRAFT_1730681 [Colletotrichum gloeosporioides 23]|nr:hypothetical protein K456DRAFT_1730681 [Colletotrichum gloeosporioides 23]
MLRRVAGWAFTFAKFPYGTGKKSKVLLRVSIVGPKRGWAVTFRDVRGWGMKIFTEEENQNWVFNEIPTTDFWEFDPVAKDTNKTINNILSNTPEVNQNTKPLPVKEAGNYANGTDVDDEPLDDTGGTITNQNNTITHE